MGPQKTDGKGGVARRGRTVRRAALGLAIAAAVTGVVLAAGHANAEVVWGIGEVVWGWIGP